jgi:hypothetical protein
MERAELARQSKRKPPAIVPLPNRTSPDEFVERINAAWHRSVAGIFEAGRLLIEAKAQIEPGHFQEMIRNELPFVPSVARRLMQIARHEILLENMKSLPAHWRNIYDLAMVPDAKLRAGFANGTISPKIKHAEISKLRGDRPTRKGSRRPSQRPIAACVNYVRAQVEAIDAAQRAELIGRLRDLLDQLEALAASDHRAAAISPAAVV